MIRLRDVHLSLASSAGSVHILKGIDLDVEDGASLGVVGPSGSGKSSLLAIIGGIERPTSGHVAVAGVDLASLDEDGLALFRRQRVGVLFQSFHLIATMTALENVALPLELAGRRDAFERARAGLVEVGLEARLEHFPTQLSGGEQQRVALARALANEPELLLADEPTGNLDSSTGRQIAELIFAARERRGATLFLITHDPTLAGLCDDIRRMNDGRLEPVDVAAAAFAGAEP